MKVIICTTHHETERWFFDLITRANPQITRVKYIRRKDVELRRNYPRYLFLRVMAFFTIKDKYELDVDEITSYYSRTAEAMDMVSETSTFSGKSQRRRSASSRRRLRRFKKYTWPLFWFFLRQMKKYDVMICFNGVFPEHKLLAKAAKSLGKKTIFCEVGPFADTITMDEVGVNYGSSIPRKISFYKKWAQENSEKILHAGSDKAPKIGVRKTLLKDFRQKNTRDLSGKYIFFPLQVFFDTQILFYNDWVENIQHLVEIVHQAAQRLPEGWRVIAKEHPECPQRYDVREMESDCFSFANGNTTPDLIKNASLIITLNSSVGLEAMLLNKPVVTLGQAFYAFDDLTRQCHNIESVFEVFKNPEQVSFCLEDRWAFLSWLISDYYLDGSFHKKTFTMTQKNKRLIGQRLASQTNAG